MALSKAFASGTKYYYVRVSQFNYTRGGGLFFVVERRVRDTGDVEYDSLESTTPFNISESPDTYEGVYDSNDRWSMENLDMVDTNFIQQCYELLKSDIEEYKTGWTDV